MRAVLGLPAVLSAALRFVFTAVIAVVLASLLTAAAEGQGDPEPCSGRRLFLPAQVQRSGPVARAVPRL